VLNQTIHPNGILKEFINFYHIIESESHNDFFPLQRHFSDGSIVLVFHYYNPSLYKKHNELPYIEPRTVLCGQQTKYYDLAIGGKTGMVMIVFKPYGAGMFFKLPMSEIKNDNVALGNIIFKKTLEIEDKIQRSKTNIERIKLIEDFLFSQLTNNNKNYKQIKYAIESFSENKGQITIKTLAEKSFLSLRQFERKFSELVGLNPKQYARIVRFQHVIQKKKEYCKKDFITLAMECGYYDQAHFINDFKNITDLSPQKFFNSYI
jgi:AraC-like DNA-binding protein